MQKKLLIVFIMISSMINLAIAEETASPFPNAKKGINIIPVAEMNVL